MQWGFGDAFVISWTVLGCSWPILGAAGLSWAGCLALTGWMAGWLASWLPGWLPEIETVHPLSSVFQECFIRSRGAMHMRCPDGIGRESWERVGRPSLGWQAKTSPQAGWKPSPKGVPFQVDTIPPVCNGCCCCCCCCCCFCVCHWLSVDWRVAHMFTFAYLWV